MKKKKQRILPAWWRVCAVFLAGVLSVCASPAAAQDLTAESTVPKVNFVDTNPVAGGAPREVWEITGAEASVAPCENATTDVLYRVKDTDNSTSVIAICSRGTAADNTMIVDPLGDISFANGAMFIDRSLGWMGIGTNAPGAELQLNGTSPEIRLLDETDSQSFNLLYDANQFVIENGTSGTNIVGIHEAAPANSLRILSSGNTGIGTGSPAYKLEVQTTGEDSAITAVRTDGATVQIAAKGNKSQMGTVSNHRFNLVVANSPKMTLDTTGNVGIGVTTPTHLLQLSGGAYSDGATWQDASSRQYKENIKDLTATEALETLKGLNPVRFNYKAKKGDEHVGFIAEDVPDLVASQDRKGMSSMDVVAVLAKVVKEQQKTIEQLNKKITELENRVK